MKGNNELQLNQSTMIQAVQTWLDTNVLRDGHGQKVVAVEQSNSIDGFFVVKLTDQNLSPSTVGAHIDHPS